MLPATSAAVRPTRFPGTQYLFYLVEREVVVPNGLRYIGLSVQAESLTATLLEDEQLDTIECESAEAALATLLRWQPHSPNALCRALGGGVVFLERISGF
jgi:hypothetical protein